MSTLKHNFISTDFINKFVFLITKIYKSNKINIIFILQINKYLHNLLDYFIFNQPFINNKFKYLLIYN